MHIILIARHYPPEISGGARRPYLLTQAFRELGHSVTVVTPFKTADTTAHIHVPHPVESIDRPAPLPSLANSAVKTPLRTALRQWLLWPDPDIRWARRVKAKLTNMSIQADWVITTSPSESLHVIGQDIAHHLQCRWLAECRDTWLQNPHRKILENSWLRRTGERRIAMRAFAKVDAVTAVSEAVMSDIRPLIPTGTPEMIIGHFSAPLPQDQIVKDRISLPKQDLNLVHSGGFSLSDRRRQLAPLLQNLADANRQDLHLHIAGRLTAEEQALVQAKYLFKVSWHGQVTLEQSQALQVDSDALLLITPEDSHALPGKFAEYQLAGRPILFSGGGDWLSLVEDRSQLAELNEELKTLVKGTARKTSATITMTHMDAAKALINFLEDTFPH